MTGCTIMAYNIYMRFFGNRSAPPKEEIPRGSSGLVLMCGEHRKTMAIVVSIVFSVLPGLVRFMIHVEISLLIFHLIPVVMATWCISTRWGIITAFISIASWLYADIATTGTFTSPLIPALNEGLTLVGFLFTVYILSRLRLGMERERELASMDHLTGIFNRRAFYEKAGFEIDRSRRFSRPLSAAYLDLDNFKDINDSHGHSTGDSLLRTVALTVSTHIRAVDIFARVGGDEFVILFPETGSGSIQSVAEKLSAHLATSMKARRWDVTFSLGVITFDHPPENVDEILRLSDMVMYRAKREGKNCIRYEVR